jgi:hypothetical protein
MKFLVEMLHQVYWDQKHPVIDIEVEMKKTFLAVENKPY